MKNFLLLFIAFLGFTSLLEAQSFDSPCGTKTGRSQWLKDYQKNPAAYTKGGDTTLYVAMSIHIVGTDSGTGYYPMNSLIQAFCKLNELYEPTGIQFFMQGDVHYINNSAYYQHETVLEGAQMMFEHNIPNTLNCYFVSDPAGNCGYNLPYAGLTNAKSCAGPDDVTWAHEVGHALNLPHPFYGWEGGVSHDGSVDHSYSDPAPELITVDYTYFQDTLIMDTMIIDTVIVEKVDGSNCTQAADGFCDTSPDYLAGRWNCNVDGVSSVFQTDPNGETFQSDGSLIMAYSDDQCQTRFTNDQQAAMRADILDEHPDWLSLETVLGSVEGPATLLGPINGEIMMGLTAELSWEAVPNATHYVVQISRLSSFPSGLTEEFITTNTSVVTEELLDNKTYYWKVLAYNKQQFCSSFTDNETFLVQHPTAVNEIAALSDVRIYPQPLKANQDLLLALEMTENWDGYIRLYSVLGQKTLEQAVSLHEGNNQLRIATSGLSKGVYLLELTNGLGRMTQKIVVQ